MNNEFNKKRMLDNISFILKEMGKKIGELEMEAGVSPGYISRTSKDNNAKPGIDFIVNVANALNTSVDTLLSVNLTGLTPTERYLISFIEKLKNDTITDKLDWTSESAESLNRLELDRNGYISHPLFSYETFFEESECEYPNEVSRVVFNSHSFGCNTLVAGNCFNLRMKNHAVLYLMKIRKSVCRVGDHDAFATEIWMHNPQIVPHFLCSTKNTPFISAKVDDLYWTVEEFAKHPKIKRDVKETIDAFMQDDWSDDDYDYGLPFN